jgi:type I restriction enzyme R subunit
MQLHPPTRSETARLIQLIDPANQMREADKRDEVNDSAVKVLGDDTLKTIARELVDTVRKNTSIDWTVKESVKAMLRTMVKRILRKYGYPPDKQEKATKPSSNKPNSSPAT